MFCETYCAICIAVMGASRLQTLGLLAPHIAAEVAVVVRARAATLRCNDGVWARRGLREF
jgi:hypothetical protein